MKSPRSWCPLEKRPIWAPQPIIRPRHSGSQRKDGYGCLFAGLFSQDPPFLLFTARPGSSQDSQETRVATNCGGACKQRPGLADVYPTTPIGYCRACVPQTHASEDRMLTRTRAATVGWRQKETVGGRSWGSLIAGGENKAPAGTSSCGRCSLKAAGLWQKKKKTFWLNSCWTEEQLAAEVVQISHRSGWNQKGHSKQKRLCACGWTGGRWCICCKSAGWWTPSSGVWTVKGELLMAPTFQWRQSTDETSKLHYKKFPPSKKQEKSICCLLYLRFIIKHVHRDYKQTSIYICGL